MKPELRPGDYFCVQTGSWVAKPILWFQKLKALDDESTYNHAGIVVKEDGKTFESLAKIAHYDINGYAGHRILVARHCAMTPEKFEAGYDAVRKFDGTVYPAWRLFWHAIGMAKLVHVVRIPVCSELVVEHCHAAGLCNHGGFGWSPDALADKFRDSKRYEVIYEGVW